MAFQLQVSNSLNKLAEQLCADVQLTAHGIFQPIFIVTQTEGMNNWLKYQMADQIGIAANCRFLKPNDLINAIYYLLQGASSPTLSAENLNWLLFTLLAEKNFAEKHAAIATYYTTDGPDSEVKRMALAEKVADLFDQYQIYRTDMIERWNKKLTDKTTADDWQQELWLNAKKLTATNFPDKTLIGKAIEEELKNPDQAARLQQKMPVIYLFGISLITAYHVHILQVLANYVDIHFLMLNPAPAVYWFEDKSEKQLAFLKKIGKRENTEISMGNALLTGWGKIIQDMFYLLFKNEDLINAYEELESVEPAQDNLLHKIQYSIYQNENIAGDDRLTIYDIQDGTVVINSCYSPVREVEALYNYLVHLIDQRKASLSPGDIVVMVSDINLYASYIKAIFDNAPYPFRYTIADESYSASDSRSNALHAVLSITDQNFTAENVIRLLDSSFIRERFQLTNLSLIRNILNEANIRFGMEGNLDDESVYISWRYGLQRIMYGICMSGDTEYFLGEEGFFPLEAIEGNAAHEVIRFVHFVTGLMDAIDQRKEAKTIADWVTYVEMVLHNFVCDPEETTDEEYAQLLGELENYNSFTELFTAKVSYPVFMHSYLPTLANAVKKNTFAVGGITFCSLIPMRSIPFKVVALLGLNFDKFPRRENSLGFNLMEKEKRKGDRNVKENDKHLFLETILSAREYFYISYIGQSIKDNTNIPPSTLVDEWVDYIASSCLEPKKVRELLITRQPLHGFSQKYLAGNDRLYSYLSATKPANKNLQQQKQTEPLHLEEVTIEELIRFLKNPFKGYYNKVLGIYYQNDDITLRDTELFELNKLQQWGLKNQLLQIDTEIEKLQLKNKLVKTGALPLKNMAGVQLQNIETEVTPVAILFKSLVGEGEKSNLAVNLQPGKFHLTGNIPLIYGDKLVVISWSKREIKYLLEAYLLYLAARASGATIDPYFISAQKKKIYPGTAITQQDAIDQLTAIVQLYVNGHKKIIAFDPDFNLHPAEMEQLDAKLFQKALKGKFGNNLFPCDDNYMNKEHAAGYFEAPNIIQDTRAAAEKLLLPLARLFPAYFEK